VDHREPAGDSFHGRTARHRHDGVCGGVVEPGAAHLARWEDAANRFETANRRTHAVRMFFGIESFGVDAFEAHQGELLVVAHDELDEGERHEELYLVVEGRARFVCDDEPVELGPGELLPLRLRPLVS
jgi:mannose-6-phosphate isomerase-like protein (cupin superfamily)